MSRSISDIETELSVLEGYRDEWKKPLWSDDITNRFTESTADGILIQKLDDPSSWGSYDNFLLGNINQFCIFELGEDSNGDDIIRTAYEIGNETIKISGTGESSVNTLQFWELNLFNDRGFSSSLYTDDTHLAPYYPDNLSKYTAYVDISGSDSNIIGDFYMESVMDDFDDCNVFFDPNTVTINHNSTNIASFIPNIEITDLGGMDVLQEFVKPSGYNPTIRENIYTSYCNSLNWWFDDTGEVAGWHNGDQGVYTGSRKIVSSWQIYEWILSEIEELEREKSELQLRIQTQIDEGKSIGDLLTDAGLTAAYSKMFTEYPGIFDTVKVQYGFYTYVGAPSLNDETRLFEKYGYKSVDSITNTFTDSTFTYGVDVEKIKSYFSISHTIDLGSGGTTGTMTIWRLRYDDFLSAPNKIRYFISVYTIGLRVIFSEPCPWDGIIVFIVVAIITYFLGPQASASVYSTFASYLAIFSLWTSYLELGGERDRKLFGYISTAASLFASYKQGLVEAGKQSATEEVTTSVAVAMAERKVLLETVVKAVLDIVNIYISEQLIIDEDNPDKEPKDFEEDKETKQSKKDRRKYEDNFQFQPLERLLAKQEFSRDKINKHELFDYRIKENNDRY